MTAATQTRTHSAGWLLALAVLGLLAIAISVPDVGSVELSDHAVERHGQDAWRAREAAQSGGPGGHWRCKDGKEYVLNALGGGDWAVTVIRDGIEITSFVSRDRGYIQRVLQEDGCTKAWQGGHP